MTITQRIDHLRQSIHNTAMACHYQGDVTMLGVSKGQSPSDIKEAFAAGLDEFGENYLQEALPKIAALKELPLTWHFIGPIQSNKAHDIAQHFAWVHSVSRLKIATLLNDGRPLSLPRLNICIQVNFDDENTKAGVSPDDVKALASYVLELPRLKLCGLMLIPKQEADQEQQYQSFLRLTHLQQKLNQELGINMGTLSMGMSHDFKAAIRAGSTMVRIGTAIFGERKVRT